MVSNVMDISGVHVYEQRFQLNIDMILISFTYDGFAAY